MVQQPITVVTNTTRSLGQNPHVITNPVARTVKMVQYLILQEQVTEFLRVMIIHVCPCLHYVEQQIRLVAVVVGDGVTLIVRGYGWYQPTMATGTTVAAPTVYSRAEGYQF